MTLIQGSPINTAVCLAVWPQVLPMRQDKRDDGEVSDTWQLCDVEAGSRTAGLTLRCLDEIGRPAARAVKGKLQVGLCWGTKQAVEL